MKWVGSCRESLAIEVASILVDILHLMGDAHRTALCDQLRDQIGGVGVSILRLGQDYRARLD